MCGSRGGIGGPDPPGKSQVIWGSIEISICGAATSKFFGPVPCGPGEGSKGQISFNFNYKSQFQRQMKDTKYIRRDLGHAPGVGLWGTGGAQVIKNLFFSKVVTRHIKSTRMTS